MNAAVRVPVVIGETALVATLAVATILPVIDLIGGPLFGFRLASTHLYVQHATLWLAFLGAVAATADGSHLTLSTAALLGDGRARRVSQLFAFSVAAAVSAVLAYASYTYVVINKNERVLPVLEVPEWVSALMMPVGLAVVALLFAWKASDRWWGRALALLAIPAAFAVGLVPAESARACGRSARGARRRPARRAGVRGDGRHRARAVLRAKAPRGGRVAEVYRLHRVADAPRHSAADRGGYVLAESAAAERLVRFFRALFGWMPGGIAVMVAAVCAMFTTFTGGSGVTIIALGGLVYPILRKDGYPRGSRSGLVTASGSWGCSSRPAFR